MERLAKIPTALALGVSYAALSGSLATAQVIPDKTLGELSTVLRTDLETGRVIVNGGAQENENLFHSFENLSVGAGQSVLFEPSTSVKRIFGRVTGGNLSVIDGQLGVSGLADLFLINPAGISFGSNAFIDLEGSFLASSAQRVIFGDALTFSAVPETSPLSSTVPVGLDFSGNSRISVEDIGHTISSSLAIPYVERMPTVGLSARPGKGIVLLGGNIDLRGAILRAPDGNISLGAVQEGYVAIPSSWKGDNLDYSDVSQFGSIVLDHLSLVDASGISGGSISIKGQDIQFLDSSIAKIESQDIANSQIEVSGQSILLNGEISKINPGTLSINNFAPTPFLSSRIEIVNYSSESPGNINVSGQNVSLLNGAIISQRSYGEGVPGHINVSSDKLVVDGANSQSDNPSFMGIFNLGPSSRSNRLGNGRVVINSDAVEVTNGGVITSSTFHQGDGGRLEINAEDILVSSVTDKSKTPSQISALSLQIGLSPIVGDGGEIFISTGSLRVLDGGAIGTSTDNSGSAGNLSVYARELVEVDGSTSSSIGSSRIGSDVLEFSQDVKDFFGFSGLPSGEGGSVLINTPILAIKNGGLIAVQNEGTGRAGDLTILGDLISLRNAGRLSASTVEGDGGNIDIKSGALLLEGGLITTTSGSSGNGGNISINSNAMALFPNSRISANAELGSGGRVVIQADALLQSPDSVISATSAAGPELDGVVEIQVTDESPWVESDLNSSAINVPDVAVACSRAPNQRGEFTVSGRGGFPSSPNGVQQTYSGWRPPASFDSGARVVSVIGIVEAQGWLDNGDGTVRFTDQADNLVTASAQHTDCVRGSVPQNRN